METQQIVTKQIINTLREGGVVSASVFGSTARRDGGPKSDLDLLVRYDKGVSLFDVINLRHRLERQAGRKVDLVAEDAIHPGLYRRIKNDLVKVL